MMSRDGMLSAFTFTLNVPMISNAQEEKVTMECVTNERNES
jgi:hypothetical protein